MKNAWWWVLLSWCAGAGCLPVSKNPEPNLPPVATPVVKPRPPEVTADQINETNAREKAQAFDERLDWEEAQKK